MSTHRLEPPAGSAAAEQDKREHRRAVGVIVAAISAIFAVGLAIGGLLFGPWLDDRSGSLAARNAASQFARQDAETSRLISAEWARLNYDPRSPTAGNPDGDVTVIEFFDYNCPYCRMVAPILAEIRKTDKGVRFIFKEFPILGPSSDFAARAALAAQKQDGYLALHAQLMQGKAAANESTVMMAAEVVGLDADRLRADMDDPAIAAAIEQNHALALRLRISSTPTFVIGNRIYRGAADLETFRAEIALARRGEE